MPKIKISAIILTKDEPNYLESCIKHIKPYVDEVIVIDSSVHNSLSEIISNDAECRYYRKKIGDENINGFSDLRNFGNAIADNDWCIHVDTDEIFPNILFDVIDNVITNNKTPIWAYAFPRINLPFYEGYPDYQTRLVNRVNTEWINKIHEKVDILTKPHETRQLDHYPIIHIKKSQQEKTDTNKRWLQFRSRKVVICSLFNNSEYYIHYFLMHLKDLIEYSEKNIGYKIDLCFIEGNSADSTYSILKDWVNQLPYTTTYHFNKIDLPESMDRFTKLAILRNMLIKFGLRNYHDYVLMIDSDTIPQKTLLHHLIQSLEANYSDVMAPLVFIEDFRNYKDEYMYDTLAFIDSNNENFKHYYPHNTETTNKDLIKMNSVGTCYIAKSEVYNINDFKDFSITKCYTESHNKYLLSYEGMDTDTNIPTSEQVIFFKKLKQKGFQVYVDSNIKILHINLEKLGMKWH